MKPSPTDVWADQLHNELRSATGELHRKLDSHAVLSPLISPTVTLGEYHAALLALHAITAPAEDRIGEYCENRCLPMDYGNRRRMPLLLADLDFFGLTPGEPAWNGPRIRSDAALVGCLYVVEGAALGGRMILRRMAAALFISDRRGGRYFNGHGDRTQTLWRDFWRFASRHCRPDDLPTACRSAVALFGSYLTLLDQYRGRQA